MRAADRIGSVVASKYRLEHLLGEGGMGAVFCATHLTIGKRFAIKLLHAEISKHPDAKRRFNQEAQAAARIGHPAILDVYDLGETEEGGLYMVMELLSGESLAERVARGPLPISEALRYAVDVLTALEAAHDVGIIHRDIKPANVFLVAGADGATSVRVLDFGIAKFQEGVDGAKTSTGAVLGSPHYMAPEQVRAESEIDPRADVWAVGATLYELLVGEPAHLAPTHAAVIAKIVMKQAPAVSARRPEVDAGIDAIVARALSIEPAGRFASAAEMRTTIEAYLVGRAATVISVPPPALSDTAKARVRAGGASTGGNETPRAVVADAATDLSPLQGGEPEPARRSLLPLAVGVVIVSAISTAVLLSRQAGPRAAASTELTSSATARTADSPPPAAPASTQALAGSSSAPAASASASASAPASASPPASASAAVSGSASASARRVPAPPSGAARPATCAAGQELTNGHCCARGFIWQSGRCERDIAVTPPF